MSRRSRQKAALQRTVVTSSNTTGSTTEGWAVFGVCIGLAAITLIVFGQTVHHDFLDYDDNVYVFDNPPVANGLTLQGILWAFTHVHSSNWHPLTWISHMLDCQLYGLNPSGHHLTNVLVHAATAILLFLLLRRMMGYLWRAAFVAAVFAVHPLRVESVAWVAERKDVLSGLFFMLTLGAYVRYAQSRLRIEKRESSELAVSSLESRRSARAYGLVLLFFALGLMSKPMLVTLPFFLLLLDYWPLGRFAPPGGRFLPTRLIVEKIPLLVLSAGACAVTFFAQTVARKSFDQISLPLRIGNALISYVTYIGQMFWPSNLAVLYPFSPREIDATRVALSLVGLTCISMAVLLLRRRRPYLMVGWLWYLLMLGPVIGIVWVGTQARADRYTYLPQIGLYVLLTWAAADFCASWRWRRGALGISASLVLAALIFQARVQASYWRNSETLWTHTLACTSDNSIAHYNLGNALTRNGEIDEAIAHYQTAVQIKPNYAEAHYNLAGALFQKGRVDEAIDHYQMALKIDPDYVDAHNNLGNAFLKKGQLDEAIAHYQRAVQLKPEIATTYVNLGNAFARKERIDDAIVQFRSALKLNPNFAEAHFNLSRALMQKGDEAEAMTHYERAMELKRQQADARRDSSR